MGVVNWGSSVVRKVQVQVKAKAEGSYGEAPPEDTICRLCANSEKSEHAARRCTSVQDVQAIVRG